MIDPDSLPELPEGPWRTGLDAPQRTGASASSTSIAAITAGPPDVVAVCAALEPYWEPPGAPGIVRDRRIKLRALGGYLARRGWPDEPLIELAECLGSLTSRGPQECIDTMLEAAEQARGDDDRAAVTAGWSSLLEWSPLAAKAIEHATARHGLTRPVPRPVDQSQPMHDAPPSADADAPSPETLAFDLGPKGAVKAIIENVERVIDAYLPRVVRYESSSGRVIVHASPWRDDGRACDEDLGHFPVGEWTDTHTSALMRLCDRLDLTVSSLTVDRAVDLVARRDQYNAITEYAEACAAAWDGTPRIETCFADYLGCDSEPSTRAAARVFLRALAARALWPGCQAEVVLVVHGDEGHGKSSILRALTGARERFSDSAIDPRDRDAYQSMRGVWLWEWGEDLPKGRDWAQVKAFLSSTTDRYRPSYGRHPVSVPRQTVFAMTTNEEVYLPDPRGARRFLPITMPRKLSREEHEAWIAVAPQLIGEAVHAVRDAATRGEPWWISAEDEALLAERRAEHTDETRDPWCDAIEAWIAKRPELSEITIRDVLAPITGAVPIELDRQDRRSEMRAGKALRSLGYRRVRQRGGGARGYAYVRDALAESLGARHAVQGDETSARAAVAALKAETRARLAKARAAVQDTQ